MSTNNIQLDTTNETTPIDLQAEINNLLKISQALEMFPITGSSNMYSYSSCVQSLNSTIGKLIQYIQQNKD